MKIDNIKSEIRSAINSEIELMEEGKNRFRVFSPFIFEDGDQFSVLLKADGKKWYLSDEGHTYMHLSYDIDVKDFEKGSRQKILSNILSGYDVVDKDGELIMFIDNEQYGNSLFSYLQALTKISDLNFLSREIVKSTFYDDFSGFIKSFVPGNRLKESYIEKEFDPNGVYPVDFRINQLNKPIYLFGIQNESKCKDVTISILQYEKWGVPFHPIAVFEDQQRINRKVLARFSDVVDKQFSNLFSNKERINNYISDLAML